jgi:hypothetical protein
VGEAKRKKSATRKFIEQYPDCCFCAGSRPACTREHMPPKAVFDASHRPDKLVMPACNECNNGTSTADLTVAIISRWGYSLTQTENDDHHRLVVRVRKQAPSLLKEWTKPIDRMNARAHLEKHGVVVPEDAGMASIGPETIRQLNLFAYKFVLGLYFEHFGKLLLDTGRVAGFWRTKEDFGSSGIPTMLLEMMKRYGTLEQGQWNVREVFEYRYEANEKDGLFACLGRFRGNLFFSGFAVRNVSVLPEDDQNEWGWIKPTKLLDILTDAKFDKRP